MAKARKLRDITLKELSFVDKPANMLPFLFFKREGSQSVELLQKAKKKIKIEIESDGSVKGTTITVNGDKLGELKSFDFCFWGNEPKSTVSCSYSKVVESEGGFKRTESYYLTKGEIMLDEKTLKSLESYLGVEKVDFEKKASDEEIQVAMKLIEKNYKESFPEDLEKAIGVLAKCAVGSLVKADEDDVQKAGAKFSRDTLKKLTAIVAAAQSLLEGGKQSTEKSNKDDDEKTELAKQLKEITDSISEMKKASEGEAEKSAIDKLAETVGTLVKRLETVEKGGATRKSLEDQDNSDDDDDVKKGAGEDGKVLWPSFSS